MLCKKLYLLNLTRKIFNLTLSEQNLWCSWCIAFIKDLVWRSKIKFQENIQLIWSERLMVKKVEGKKSSRKIIITWHVSHCHKKKKLIPATQKTFLLPNTAVVSYQRRRQRSTGGEKSRVALIVAMRVDRWNIFHVRQIVDFFVGKLKTVQYEMCHNWRSMNSIPYKYSPHIPCSPSAPPFLMY